MANQITDNRTNVDTMEAASAPDDLAGNAGGTNDTEIFYQGSSSWGFYTTSSRDGLLHDAGSAQNWSSNVFYLLMNCGVVGLLDTKANGGCTVRFCGNTVTNWFEVYVGGSDDWPTAFSGGWVQWVVDIDDARSTAVTNGWTNGTTPATSAIRYVGVTTITGGTMPRMADNTWLDQIARLPIGNPGIIVEGRNAGTTDWTWDDIVSQADTGKWGTARTGPGGTVVLNTPVQFGINDTSTHAFTDTNKTILWDDQEFAPTDLYEISALGNSGGTTNVTMGVKTGTGDAATGAQGCIIQAASGGARWAADFDDPDVDGVNLYGCTFQHGGDFQLDDPAVSVISTSFIDCTSATVSNAADFLRCAIIDANTADGVAFLTTDDLGDVVFCNFEFSDGHAVELTTPRVASQDSKGNLFTGYGTTTSNDAAIYNNTAGAVTVNVTNDGTSPTYRDGTSASTVISNSVTVKVTAIETDGTPIQSARVHLRASDGTGPFPYQESVTIARTTTTATVTHTAHGMASNDKVLIRGITDKTEDNGVQTITFIDANSYSFTTTDSGSTSYTGTITSTFVALDDVTDVNGEVSGTRTYPSNQPVTGWTRKSTSSPYFKEGVLTGDILSASGYDSTAVMVSDE